MTTWSDNVIKTICNDYSDYSKINDNFEILKEALENLDELSTAVPQAVNKAPNGILETGSLLVPVLKSGVVGNFVKDGKKKLFSIPSDTNLDSFPASSTKFVFAIFDNDGVYQNTDYVDNVQRGFGVTESSVIDGDYYYDGFDMYKGVSGAWVQTNAICLGRITSDATSITEVTDIALSGMYSSATTTIGTTSEHTFAHNLFTKHVNADGLFENSTDCWYKIYYYFVSGVNRGNSITNITPSSAMIINFSLNNIRDYKLFVKRRDL